MLLTTPESSPAPKLSRSVPECGREDAPDSFGRALRVPLPPRATPNGLVPLSDLDCDKSELRELEAPMPDVCDRCDRCELCDLCERCPASWMFEPVGGAARTSGFWSSPGLVLERSVAIAVATREDKTLAKSLCFASSVFCASNATAAVETLPNCFNRLAMKWEWSFGIETLWF